MPSITGWNRLEPRARNVDFAESLAAKVHDPLWFLARQWQLKEFEGEDGGTAVGARMRGMTAPLTRVRIGFDGASKSYDGQTPLEVVVERESMRTAMPNARDAAETGLVWLRMLAKAGLETLRDVYIQHAPLATEDSAADQGDLASIRFRRVLGGRVPDGAQLYAELDAALRPEDGGSGELPPNPAVDPVHQPTLEAVARRWLDWWDEFADEPAPDESAWIPAKLEYQFAAAAPHDSGEYVLEAEEYAGGHLDWYMFRLQRDASLGASMDADQITAIERTVTPMPVEIPGNPADRFWEFEDGRVDLARLEAGPEDVARMLLTEFALIYGNDWLFIPVDLPVGSVFRTDELEITDTFGATVRIPPSTEADAEDERWGFFHISEAAGAAIEHHRPAPIFVLPPVLAASLDGPAIEEVQMMRDEMANLAWAVEQQVVGSRGRAIDRNEIYQRRRAPVPPPSAPASGANIRYRMLGRVPDHWIPLMPVRQPGELRSFRLQRGSVRDPESGEFHRPIGRILVPEQALFIDEEDVPRAGIRVIRAPQYARWTDGSVHLWMARRKTPGRGPGWSGLRFDHIDTIRKSGP